MSLVTSPPANPELAAELARRGISYTALAHEVRANSQYISQVVKGQAQPSAALMQRIAEALGRPVAELFESVSQ